MLQQTTASQASHGGQLAGWPADPPLGNQMDVQRYLLSDSLP